MLRPLCGKLEEHELGLCDCAGFWPVAMPVGDRRTILEEVLSKDRRAQARITAAFEAGLRCVAERGGAPDDCLACVTTRVAHRINIANGLPVVTPWAVTCPIHGRQFLSQELYLMSLNYARAQRWRCPRCGADATWDDKHFLTYGYEE